MRSRELRCYACAYRGVEPLLAEWFVVSLDQKLKPVCSKCGNMLTPPMYKLKWIPLEDGINEYCVQMVMDA